MLLLKFQKEEYLKPIQQGVFHFSSIETYRDDPTSFRGDEMEGKLFGDPKSPFLINGIDISPYLKSVIFSKEYEGRILSICFSKLDLNNCHEIGEDLYTPNNDFIEEMTKFGTSFITISSYEFCDCMAKALENKKCSYSFHSIIYNDKND